MAGVNTNGKKLYIARHGETIFNKAGRIQGDHPHTPLTMQGFAQADEMGRALARHLRDGPLPVMLASDTGRALQTLSVVAEHIGADWHQAAVDPRLREIDMGEWGGAYYRDLQGQLEVDQGLGLFMTQAPGGENYPMIAERVRHWIAEQSFISDMLIISHGMTSRVLRGVLTGLDALDPYGAPIADGLPQGSMVAICDGAETILHLGGGEAERA